MYRMRRLTFATVGFAVSGVGFFLVRQAFFVDRHAKRTEAHVMRLQQNNNARIKSVLPTREEQIRRLKEEKFDVFVIGGGATGSGCALDATTRGLKTAMVELDDFSSGTSSRSTKLIHGGLRYLQKAIMKLDYEQYKMVKEALHERANLLAIAPHLSFPLPIMLPIYKLWQLPYYWMGIKAYDAVSGIECLKSSYVLSKESALEQFPMLKRDKLKGAIVYYDGSHNDARMCLSIAITAARQGAVIANYVRVTELVKNGMGKVSGVKMRDELTGEEWLTETECVINATGPFTDSIRKMDDVNVKDIVQPSSGVHIVLPNYYSPQKMGLLDPETKDGRVIFLVPWQDSTIAGTTDRPCDVTFDPSPPEEDIKFILDEVRDYLSKDVHVRRADVQSAWVGIRPLILDPNKEDTQELVRNHVIHVSASGLVTIAGGKWTTYRSMAAETLDKAVEASNLEATSESQTDGLLLEGAHGWTPTMYIKLVQDLGVDTTVAQHLAETYGDRAFEVGRLARETGNRWPVLGNRLHPEYPYIEAEVRYACRREYACTATDIIARRLRLSFLNVQATEEALPRIVELMAEELNWDEEEQLKQLQSANMFLKTQMGKDVNRPLHDLQDINLTADEIKHHMKVFKSMDNENKGHLNTNDLRNLLDRQGKKVSGPELREMINDIDINQNGQVDVEEYLALMSAIKKGSVKHSKLASVAEAHAKNLHYGETIERSGGGV